MIQEFSSVSNAYKHDGTEGSVDCCFYVIHRNTSKDLELYWENEVAKAGAIRDAYDRELAKKWADKQKSTRRVWNQ